MLLSNQQCRLSRVGWCLHRASGASQVAVGHLSTTVRFLNTQGCLLFPARTSATPLRLGTACIAETALVAVSSTTATVDASYGMVSILAMAGSLLAGLAVIGAFALALFLSPELRAWPAAWMERHLFPDANQITPLQMAQKRDQSKVYRILAFGDSLTEGFTQ